MILIEDKNFNLIMLTNAAIHLLPQSPPMYPKHKYAFQIKNENRVYVLSTKSLYDLEQWVFAI